MENLTLENLSIKPLGLHLYVPPIVWKGDSLGHIGANNVFFWVLEGECFLTVDSQSYIVRPGQLAFLPKGKMRAYTHVSEQFSMYEMAFDVKMNDSDLMSVLGLDTHNFVVDIPEREKISALFGNSHRVEFFRNPIHDAEWCANIINIICTYAQQRKKQDSKYRHIFKPVLEYMSQNISKDIKIEDMAATVYMQPTYFIKKFKNVFGMTPMVYLNRDRMFNAMGLLVKTNLSIREIASNIGISDVSYFARVFKKYCGVSPSEYRMEFKQHDVL